MRFEVIQSGPRLCLYTGSWVGACFAIVHRCLPDLRAGAMYGLLVSLEVVNRSKPILPRTSVAAVRLGMLKLMFSAKR